MLKSITIESWDCSLRQANGNPAAKKLTLRSNGHVIFVEKDFGDKENTSIITHKTFDKEGVRKLLDKAEKLFTPAILSTDIKTWFCDACPDMITLKKENGEVIYGQLNYLTYELNEVVGFYDDIEKSLNFNVDLTFENESNN
ncbi:MAG: hypothetical protein J5762_02685 [Clostridia bacterium]|nr:hypothetical protein [Clostridia bacterium]